MFMGMGMPIPDLSNLPGVSRPGRPGDSGATVDQITNQYSFNFDRASGTYMTTGITLAADSNFSVSFWIKGGVKANFFTPGIFPFGAGNGSNSTLGRIHANKFMLQTADNTGGNGANRVVDIDIYDGNYHHIAFTRDNASGQFFAYADGINVIWTGVSGGSDSPSLTFNPSGDLYLGTAGGNTSYAFDGWLDEFALFYRTLTEEEIKAIYDATTSGKTADLNTLSTGAPYAWYRMGD